MPARNYLNTIISLGLGKTQTDLYQKRLENLQDVEVVPLSQVLTPTELDMVRSCNFVAKECYKNAMIFSYLFPRESLYIEGYVTGQGLFPIDHAWNKIRGKYVDVTMELVLDRSLEDQVYQSVGAYTYDRAIKAANETGYYGAVNNFYKGESYDYDEPKPVMW